MNFLGGGVGGNCIYIKNGREKMAHKNKLTLAQLVNHELRRRLEPTRRRGLGYAIATIAYARTSSGERSTVHVKGGR